MQNDGQLVVKDGDGAVIWSSRTETGTSTAAQGWTYQITSNGKPGVSCTVRKAHSVIQWFATNWPADLNWPSDIPRPPKTRKDAA